jgi:hypothetical protein
MLTFVLGFAVVLVIGCGETVPVEAPTGSPTATTCVERPFRSELHVDARDPRLVWATLYETGQDVVVRPRPPGRFTFDPTRPKMLLDGAGKVVSFAGEISQSGCFDAINQTVDFGPGDLPDPNRAPG